MEHLPAFLHLPHLPHFPHMPVFPHFPEYMLCGEHGEFLPPALLLAHGFIIPQAESEVIAAANNIAFEVFFLVIFFNIFLSLVFALKQLKITLYIIWYL
jgi:hypothetical protein